MPEPVGELLGPIAINDVDLIVIPAAAVDRTGMRLGWGRGYFDKTLGSMEGCPPVYAVIFDSELVDAGARASVHDQPVNGVVTPTRHRRVLTADAHDPRDPMPTYSYRCTECGNALRHPAGLHRRHAHRVPECGGQLRKVFNTDRRDLQRLGLLPHRLARDGASEDGVGAAARRVGSVGGSSSARRRLRRLVGLGGSGSTSASPRSPRRASSATVEASAPADGRRRVGRIT